LPEASIPPSGAQTQTEETVQPKKVNRVPAGSVIEYPMIGPVADTVRCCIRCGQEFAPEEHWRLIGRTGRNGYFVGKHDACEKMTP
jgi:hypothetical protein